MKTLKSAVAVNLVCIFILSFAACGNKTENNTTESSTSVSDIYSYTPNETVYNEITQSVVVSEQSTQMTTVALSTEAPTTTETPETQAPTQQETQTPQVLTGVGKYTSTYAGVEQAVFYPNSIAASSETLPVVAFANGTGFSYTIYEKLIKQIAEGGYIVVANTETMSADGSAQISSLDFVVSENSNSSSVLYGKVNTGLLAVAGHSQGGRSSVNAAAKDSRIACAISLAGSNFIEEAEKLSAPTLFFAGTRDLIVGADRWVKPAYEASKGPAVYVSLKDAGHTAFSTNPEKYSGYIINWLDAWLKGNTSAKSVFSNNGALSQDSAWTDFQCKGFE